MHLSILNPEKTIYEGSVAQVTLPGAAGRFQILEGHAPIISTLMSGDITYTKQNSSEEHALSLQGGVVEVKENRVKVLVF